MDIQNVTIPAGLLQSRRSVISEDDAPSSYESTAPPELYDAVDVAVNRARAFSVALGGVGRRRAATLQTVSDRIPVVNANHTLRPIVEEIDPLDRETVTAALQRATSVNLAGLARSRALGRPNGANANVHNRAPLAMERKHSTAGTTIDNALLFQSLNNFNFTTNQQSAIKRPPPVFIARTTSEKRMNSPPPSPGLRHSRLSYSRPPAERQISGRSGRSGASGTSMQTILRRASVLVGDAVQGVAGAVTGTVHGVGNAVRRTSLYEVYNGYYQKAQIRQEKLKRSKFAMIAFRYVFYFFLLALLYFVMVGFPLWTGLVLVIYYLLSRTLVVPGGFAIFIGVAFLYAFLPLLVNFEKSAPEIVQEDPEKGPRRTDTALLIPCYKSESLIAATLEAALKIFPAESIFVIANGNSPTPLDNTADVCEKYNVSHTWSPMGSKIIAQFVGCFVAKDYPNVLLIDDDCLLPPNFPIVTDRIKGGVKVVGYTIKSTGPNSSKGTLCQQAQDIEYKLSGLQRIFSGIVGSATFPHGAISVWDREFLVQTFQQHPGFSVSEDWFFGHVARQLGSRIVMCSSVFVETETPSAVFYSSGGARGGFGEMTIWKQRFFRWNFFFVNGIYYDMYYILFNWRLGFWELGAKLFVFQEVYETVLYLLAPFVLPISFVVRPTFCAYLFAGTFAMYFLNAVIFNYVHLRSRKEHVSLIALLYYMPYKVVLTFVNILSCYHSIFEYGKYFSKRHPKVIEDDKAVEIILRLEEEKVPLEALARTQSSAARSSMSSFRPARRFTITAIGTRLSTIQQDTPLEIDEKDSADVDLTIDAPARPLSMAKPPVQRTFTASVSGALVAVQDFAIARTQSPVSIVSEHFTTDRSQSPISIKSEHSNHVVFNQDLEPILEDDTSLPGLISWTPLRPAPSTRNSVRNSNASSHATEWASALNQDLSVLHGSTTLGSQYSTSPHQRGSPIIIPHPVSARRLKRLSPRQSPRASLYRTSTTATTTIDDPPATIAEPERSPSIRRPSSPTIPTILSTPTPIQTTTTIPSFPKPPVTTTAAPSTPLPLAQAIESQLLTLHESLLAMTVSAQSSPPTRPTVSTPPPVRSNPRPRFRTGRSWGMTKRIILLPDSESDGEGGFVYEKLGDGGDGEEEGVDTKSEGEARRGEVVGGEGRARRSA